MSGEWLEYFDRLDGSPLHRAQSALYVRSLVAQVVVGGDRRVLDFGCGFGYVTAMLSPRVAEVWFWDGSSSMREATAKNTAGLPNVHPLDLLSEVTETSLDVGRPDTWFDLVLVNSVVQYMRAEELQAWLVRWRAMLRPAGRVVVSDLIPPGTGRSDLVDVVRLGIRHGSPFRAVRDALGGFADYWRTSRESPLLHVTAADLRRRAAEARLDMTVLPENLTHFRKRWTAVLRPQASER